jgi:hypothetical protein
MIRISALLVVALAMMFAACGGGYNNNMGGAGAPMLMTLSPNMATANSGAFTLTVNGSGFGTDSVVYWNGLPQMSSYASGGMVTAQITNADIMAAGMVPVYVRSGGKNSNTVDFTVQ